MGVDGQGVQGGRHGLQGGHEHARHAGEGHYGRGRCSLIVTINPEMQVDYLPLVNTHACTAIMIELAQVVHDSFNEQPPYIGNLKET